MIPRERKTSQAASTASVAPAITVCVGQFLLAATTYPGTSASTASTRSVEVAMPAMRPGSSSTMPAISRPRALTAFRASSKSIMPAATSAPYSPRE